MLTTLIARRSTNTLLPRTKRRHPCHGRGGAGCCCCRPTKLTAFCAELNSVVSREIRCTRDKLYGWRTVECLKFSTKRYKSNIFFSLVFTADPPSVPELTGDFERKKRLGDVISLQCLSRGGNPLPKITWIKNGRAIDRG